MNVILPPVHIQKNIEILIKFDDIIEKFKQISILEKSLKIYL